LFHEISITHVNSSV